MQRVFLHVFVLLLLIACALSRNIRSELLIKKASSANVSKIAFKTDKPLERGEDIQLRDQANEDDFPSRGMF